MVVHQVDVVSLEGHQEVDVEALEAHRRDHQVVHLALLEVQDQNDQDLRMDHNKIMDTKRDRVVMAVVEHREADMDNNNLTTHNLMDNNSHMMDSNLEDTAVPMVVREQDSMIIQVMLLPIQLQVLAAMVRMGTHQAATAISQAEQRDMDKQGIIVVKQVVTKVNNKVATTTEDMRPRAMDR